ncbi:MAG: DNA primase [Legionellales bacterium]|nr:DNA primase [Legionellales bacterium]HBH11160.1 DNA primase [Gammaproteobacteria bacterium]|tara:strand:+ start:12598 stop:14355 length:1758 start_codon:yes stop_codon:yes gene_type:complete
MAGKIPQNFIDELLTRTDIIDVIDAYVPLKKAGKNHKACCPFHEEKTPSFNVNQDKQFYYCFGCTASGTAITFLMEHLRIGFVEAIEDLASRAGMEIPREAYNSGDSSSVSNKLYELLESITEYYTNELKNNKNTNNIINYIKKRNINNETRVEFELGFAPPGWDNLVSNFGKSKETIKLLVDAGVIIKNDRGSYYDRFRNRLIFPIRDQRGRVIGFGGRVLGDETPKYLNSPETQIFQKGRELYGLFQARKASRDLKDIYIVEGYMDVIALAQFGIKNVVATLGTAATFEHIGKLFRITNKLIFCFDGDKAGKKAAWRALENSLSLLKNGRQVYFIFLPNNEDPDTFVNKNGKNAFINTEMLTPLSDFLFNSISHNINLEILEGRSEMINKTLPYLAKLPLDPYKDIIVKELSKITGYEVNDIQKQLSIPEKSDLKKLKNSNKKVENNRGIEKIRWLIRCLLHQPSLALNVESTESLLALESSGIDFLCELIQLIKKNPNITLGGILENWRDSKFEKRLCELASEEDEFNEIGVTNEVFTDAISGLIETHQKEFETFKKKSSPLELTDEEKLKYREMQKSSKDS